MKHEKISLYVGCSLTHAPESFRASVEAFKDTLRQHYEIMDFLGLVAGTAQDVYAWDIKQCVEGCALFVAICDIPSIGLGYEIATAVEKLHKPVLALAHENASVTRLIQGIDEANFTFRRYQDLRADGPRFVEEKLLHAAIDGNPDSAALTLEVQS
jgi:hypothetical protein